MGNIDRNNRGILRPLLGEATPAKASGLTYSLATILSVVLSFVFLMVIALFGVTVEGYETSDWYLYCSYLLSPVTFALTAFFVLRWSNASVKDELSSQVCKPKYFLIAVLLQCGLLCLSQLNGWFLQWLERFGYEDMPINLPSMDGFGFVGVLVAVALLPAVFEEIIFRGLLLKGMRSFGTVGAILINGALFALYHQNPAQTIYQFCCGAAFALVAIRSGSILPTVLSHFINNALILVLTKFGASTFSPTVTVVVMAVSAVCLLVSLAWLIFFDNGGNFSRGENARAERKAFWIFAAVGIALCALTWISVLLTGL